MSNPLEDILGAFDKTKETALLLDQLTRIRNAVELSAALQAYAFFMTQDGGDKAIAKLKPIIQARASNLCK